MALPLIPAAAAILALAGLMEYRAHEKRRDSIPIRIHVNGTRGKSTTTRLIAAGLRAGGRCVFAKITGTAPRVILPDGAEEALRRRGGARIIELKGAVRRAACLRAEALVAECMALEPENQKVAEHMLLRSTIGVITNVGMDHRDVMGESPEEVASALASTVPRGARLVVAPGPFERYFAEKCARLGSELHVTAAGAAEEIDAASFPYTMFPENLALALEVCRLAGVDRQTALQGMLSAPADPGVRPLRSFAWRGRSFVVVDAFAANDPEAAEAMWRRFAEPRLAGIDRSVILLNHRADRPFRVAELGGLALRLGADRIVFAGDVRDMALRRAQKDTKLLGPASFGRERRVPSLSAPRDQSPCGLLEAVVGPWPEGTKILLFLAGNTKGRGQALSEYIGSLPDEV